MAEHYKGLGDPAAQRRRRAFRRANPLKTPDPATSPLKVYTEAEMEFLAAVQAYQARTGRKFPTFTELLAILTDDLGYRKTPGPDPGRAVPSPDASAGPPTTQQTC